MEMVVGPTGSWYRPPAQPTDVSGTFLAQDGDNGPGPHLPTPKARHYAVAAELFLSIPPSPFYARPERRARTLSPSLAHTPTLVLARSYPPIVATSAPTNETHDTP